MHHKKEFTPKFAGTIAVLSQSPNVYEKLLPVLSKETLTACEKCLYYNRQSVGLFQKDTCRFVCSALNAKHLHEKIRKLLFATSRANVIKKDTSWVGQGDCYILSEMKRFIEEAEPKEDAFFRKIIELFRSLVY